MLNTSGIYSLSTVIKKALYEKLSPMVVNQHGKTTQLVRELEFYLKFPSHLFFFPQSLKVSFCDLVEFIFFFM